MTTLPAGYGYGKSSARLALVIHKLMSTTYTDIQLKQTLAKMLPEKLVRWREDYYSQGMGRRYVTTLWWIDPSDSRDTKREVLDTELLHLCWLAEETIWDTPKMEDYIVHLSEQVHPVYQNDHLVHATWQQRVIALAKVKGIEIL